MPTDCSNREIEDECHFLISCKAFDYIGDKHFQKIIKKDATFGTMNDEEKVKHVLAFLSTAFSRKGISFRITNDGISLESLCFHRIFNLNDTLVL